MSATGQAGFDLLRQSQSNLAGYIAGNFTLKVKNVADFTIEAIRPDVSLIAGLDQLRRHADAAPVTAYASFQHIRDAEFPGDLWHILVPALVLHGGRSRNDAEMRRIEAAKLRNHFIGHAVCEIFLLGISAEIFEWQHGERDLAGAGNRRFEEVEPRDEHCSDQHHEKCKPDGPKP